MAIPIAHNGVVYTAFLPELIKRREVRTYLEIGVHKGFCLAGIEVDNAIGIDPDFMLAVDPTKGKRSLSLHKMTSDNYFRVLPPQSRLNIDFAFLDGMHLFEFLLRDIYNVERHCTDASMIVLHDALPLDEFMINRTDTKVAWTGDVWKVIPIIEKYRPDIKVVCIDCAPTGLVCLTNLDPNSDVLEKNYLKIIHEFKSQQNDREAIEAFYADREITRADRVLNEFDHTLYFRV